MGLGDKGHREQEHKILGTVISAPIRGIHPEVAPVWAIKG